MESKQKESQNKNHPKNNEKRFARLHSFLYSDN